MQIAWMVIWLILRFKKRKSVWKGNFFEDLGTTSACVARTSKFSADIEKIKLKLQYHVKNKEFWLKNSWFVSVQFAVHLAKNYKHSVMMVKIAHSRLQKKILENEKKHMPDGCWITL